MVHLFHRSRNHTKEPEPKHVLEQTLSPVPEKPAQAVRDDRDPVTSPTRLVHDATRRSNPGNPILGSMPASEEDFPDFPEPEISAIPLEGKHGAKIHYTYYPASAAPKFGHDNPFSQSIIVFLNGLMLPRSSWDQSINAFLEKRVRAGLPYPALLSYDRFGQGDSDRDVTADEVRETRAKYKAMFHPEVPNMEGLSRRNLATLLPDADGPKLEGWGGTGPYLTVVGHDWETFAEQSSNFPNTDQGSLHTPKILTMTYANPVWQAYNSDLTRITDEGKAIGPLIAINCGHFIQKDSPKFVADELTSLLDRVVNRVEQVSERTPEIRREMIRHSTDYGFTKRGSEDYTMADAPVVKFKKRGAKAAPRKIAPPPPSDSDDFSSGSEAEEDGRVVKRRKTHSSALKASTASQKPSTAGLEGTTQYAANRSATIEASSDATKQSNWFEGDAPSAKELLGTRTNPSLSSKPTSFIDRNPDAPPKFVGPQKSSSNVRTITVTDYTPDVCKDYKQTGFCGFGDNCKFLHAREDYAAGWKLDREWELSQAGKKKPGGTIVASANRDEVAKDEDGVDLALLEKIPFACLICKGPYKTPIEGSDVCGV
ncbi:RNA-splicing factor [Didymella keratinophila]|nr:RNA-splicing factor [Didymella keratinophila]